MQFSCLSLLLLVGSVWCNEPRHYNEIEYLTNAAWISKTPRPPVPAWPEQFTSDFYVYVEQYGEKFRSKGAIFYDWTNKV